MKTDRYGCRPVANPGDERKGIPIHVIDRRTGRPIETHLTRTRAVKVVKRLNQALREDE